MSYEEGVWWGLKHNKAAPPIFQSTLHESISASNRKRAYFILIFSIKIETFGYYDNGRHWIYMA